MQDKFFFLQQLRIIAKIKNLIKKEKKNKFFFILKEFYYSSWAHSYGYVKIKNIINKDKFIFKIYIFLSNLYLQLIFSGLEKVQIKNFKQRKFKTIVLSWCDKNNFKKNIYYDRYFSASSRSEKDTLWLLVSMDNFYTNKIKNVIIFRPKIKFWKFLSFLFTSLYNFLKNINLTYFFTLENFYIKIDKVITSLIKSNNFKTFICPYEGQTFQNFIINNINNRSSIKTLGYVHSALPPLPTEYIKRPGAPQKLIVHGKMQKKILINKLGWDTKEVILKESARYKRKNKINFLNKIFIPMTFEDEKKLLLYFETFLKEQKNNSLKTLTIKNHPFMNSSKKHLKFINSINLLLDKYKIKFANLKNNSQNFSIFFSATASILEALEHGVDIIHIVNDPVIEAHSPQIWKSINVKKINMNTYLYKLRNTQTYIKFQKKNYTFSNWVKE